MGDLKWAEWRNNGLQMRAMEYLPNNRMRSLICTYACVDMDIHTNVPLFSGRLYIGMIGKAARELLHTRVRRKPEIADTQTKLAGWLTGQICC